MSRLQFAFIKCFTMKELFQEINKSIWSELEEHENINSYRRELQTTYIRLLSDILYSDYGFPSDAMALSYNNLSSTLENIYFSKSNPTLDDYTIAHLSNIAETIETILNAQKQIN